MGSGSVSLPTLRLDPCVTVINNTVSQSRQLFEFTREFTSELLISALVRGYHAAGTPPQFIRRTERFVGHVNTFGCNRLFS